MTPWICRSWFEQGDRGADSRRARPRRGLSTRAARMAPQRRIGPVRAEILLIVQSLLEAGAEQPAPFIATGSCCCTSGSEREPSGAHRAARRGRRHRGRCARVSHVDDRDANRPASTCSRISLLARGALVDARDPSFSKRRRCCARGSSAAACFLIERGERTWTLGRASARRRCSRRRARARLRIRRRRHQSWRIAGSRSARRRAGGMTPLLYAARDGGVEAARRSSRRARIGSSRRRMGSAPVDGAARRSPADGLQLLLERGADRNADDFGVRHCRGRLLPQSRHEQPRPGQPDLRTASSRGAPRDDRAAARARRERERAHARRAAEPLLLYSPADNAPVERLHWDRSCSRARPCAATPRRCSPRLRAAPTRISGNASPDHTADGRCRRDGRRPRTPSRRRRRG